MRQMTDKEKRELGQKIKSTRKQKGLSQEQLAKLVGYKVGTISKYELGYRSPDIGMLRRIAVALGCDISELVGSSTEVIAETARFDEAIESYIAWLRSVQIILTSPNYEAIEGIEKTAFIVNIDGVLFDIGDKIYEIMQVGKEHFMSLVKYFGKNILDN